MGIHRGWLVVCQGRGLGLRLKITVTVVAFDVLGGDSRDIVVVLGGDSRDIIVVLGGDGRDIVVVLSWWDVVLGWLNLDPWFC